MRLELILRERVAMAGNQLDPRPVDQPFLVLEVTGRPATFATGHEARWRDAVRAAVAAAEVPVRNCRFGVAIAFRTPVARNANEAWDIDNLVKPTLDAMEGVFGARAWRGVPQPADDRVDYLLATKRTVTEDESPGAAIQVFDLSEARGPNA
jgi:hypothetical protein